jgi:uncharacterized membrane protein
VGIELRDVSLVAVFAALYAVLVYVFAPISFYALQFRVAGVLRPAIAKKWVLVFGYTLGVLVGNLFSPFVSAYELIFMPVISLLAGVLGYTAARRFGQSYVVAGMVIATLIPLGVSWMLAQLFSLPMLMTWPGLFVSEQVVCGAGALLFRAIETRVAWWP